MARIGKIGRLPQAVRAQLNSRLQDGHEGKLIVRWLNSLPEVKQVLAEGFDGRPISEQNLTDWRQGGYQEWVAYQEILAQAGDLAANHQALQNVAPGQSKSPSATRSTKAGISISTGQHFTQFALGHCRQRAAS